MKTLPIILIVTGWNLIVIAVIMMSQSSEHYQLAKDAWTCTDSRVLYEIDADGESKQIETCVEYKKDKS